MFRKARLAVCALFLVVASATTGALVFAPAAASKSAESALAQGRIASYFLADSYLLGNGTAEDAAWATMMADVVAAGGGTIRFSAKTYRLNNSWIPTYATVDGKPTQVPITLEGVGADMPAGLSRAPTTGTILDLRYDANGGIAKIDTRGIGSLTIRNMSIRDGGSGTNGTPFLHTTNTVLTLDSVFFYGSTAGASANQDAVIFGGAPADPLAVLWTADPTAPFQGYGTSITRCRFDRIKRIAYFRTYSNAIMFCNNTAWFGCGGDCCIEINGGNPDYSGGSFISGNLIEMLGYVYGFKLTYALGHHFSGNQFYDPHPDDTVGFYRLEAEAIYNNFDGGWGDTSTGAVMVSAVNAGWLNFNSFRLGQASTNDGFSRPINTYRAIHPSTTRTSVAGSVGGASSFSQTFAGDDEKRVMVRLNAVVGTVTYEFPTPFTLTPGIFAANGLDPAVVTTLTTTGVTITGGGGGVTGFLVISGYDP